MLNNKKILAIIPARGGSKGVPRKNIKKIAGMSLIERTYLQAKASKYIDHIILTTDDDEITQEGKRIGCDVPFKRPKELSDDTSSMVDVALHALREIGPKWDYIVLLQPTSPLRLTHDIDETISLCVTENADSSVSLCDSEKSPYWMYTVSSRKNITPVIDTGHRHKRRQDCPTAYVLNGAVYAINVNILFEHEKIIFDNTMAYVMPSNRSLDIDTQEDINYLEYLIKCGKVQ